MTNRTKRNEKVYMNAVLHLLPILAMMGVLGVLYLVRDKVFTVKTIHLFVCLAVCTVLFFVLAVCASNKKIKSSPKYPFAFIVMLIAVTSLPVFMCGKMAYPLLLIPLIYSACFQRSIVVKTMIPVTLLTSAAVLITSSLVDTSVIDTNVAETVIVITFTQLTVLFSIVYVCIHIIKNVNHYRTLAHANDKDERFGVYTRFQFQTRMREKLSGGVHRKYVLLVTDVIHFKVFNDLFGHEAGDMLLKNVGEKLQAFGGSDAVIGRLSDDHMACLMLQEKFSAEEYCRQFIRSTDLAANFNYVVDVCCGVYEILDSRISSDIMFDRATMAAHDKKAVSNGVAYYRASMMTNAHNNIEYLDEIKNALKEKQFTIYVQPQCDKDGNLIGAEALARWNHPRRGIVGPGDFIQICEEHNLISELDKQVWEASCAALHDWDTRHIHCDSISVNISSIDFYELDIVTELCELIKRFGLTNDRLHLEITETAIMKNHEYMSKIISKLRGLGFYVEIDDFGSGYSSLSVINDLETDMIKLDVNFLRTVDTAKHGHALLKMIYNLAEDMETDILVEGVEKPEHLVMLSKIGYNKFQGMIFSMPISKNAFEERYLNKTV